MFRTSGIVAIASACLATSGWFGGAMADEVVLQTGSAPAMEDQWTFTIAPYVWAVSVEGDTAQFGLPTVNVDASFSDILDNLDMAAMVVGEIRYGRLGLFADLAYLDLGTDSTPTPGPLFSSVAVDAELLSFTPMLSYRLVEQDGSHLDAMAGIRVWDIESKLKFDAGILPAVTAKDGDTWVDPTIGAKGRLALDENFYLTGWGIIGGFGASSDFMWDVFGGAGYAVNETFSIAAGYRGTGVDYSNNGFLFDVTIHGPMIGGVIRF